MNGKTDGQLDGRKTGRLCRNLLAGATKIASKKYFCFPFQKPQSSITGIKSCEASQKFVMFRNDIKHPYFHMK